jgi:histidyl-tRNA synthetase
MSTINKKCSCENVYLKPEDYSVPCDVCHGDGFFEKEIANPKIDLQVRGTRILIGNEASLRRKIINYCISLAEGYECVEIVLPSLEQTKVYTEKAGTEILNQMYVFKDKGDRELCLRPEGTATCQLLAKSVYKQEKDLKIWYCTTCWRYEKPQAGRYREFTQFGVEILNPTADYKNELIKLAQNMVKICTNNYEVNASAKRGLAYYVGEGFEISAPALGAQKQVCGGGSYAEGIGFALGIDRLMLAKEEKNDFFIF